MIKFSDAMRAELLKEFMVSIAPSVCNAYRSIGEMGNQRKDIASTTCRIAEALAYEFEKRVVAMGEEECPTNNNSSTP